MRPYFQNENKEFVPGSSNPDVIEEPIEEPIEE
jgi:hypothetical protein